MNIYFNENEIPYELPNVMMQLTQSSSIPSISMIVDEKVPVQQRIIIGTQIANELLLLTKSTIDYSQTGAVCIEDCPSLPALLDICQQAIGNVSKEVSLCITMNEEYLNYNSKEKLYSIENKEYNDENMVEYYKALILKYPMIKYLEDPLVIEAEFHSYVNLTQSLRSLDVQILGSRLYSSSMENVSMGMEQQWTDGMLVSTQNMLTLSNVCMIANAINVHNDEADNEQFVFCISDHLVDNCMSHYSVDLAVAARAHFIRLALPNTGICTHKYNRWMGIAEDLIALESQITCDSIASMETYYGENIHDIPYDQQMKEINEENFENDEENVVLP